MKYFLTCALAFSLLTACSSNREENNQKINSTEAPVYEDSTVKAPPPKQSPRNDNSKPNKTAPAAAAHSDWRSLINEYHDILCRQSKGIATTEDKIRVTTVREDLAKVGQTLSGTEQKEYNAAMGKAPNTEACR